MQISSNQFYFVPILIVFTEFVWWALPCLVPRFGKRMFFRLKYHNAIKCDGYEQYYERIYLKMTYDLIIVMKNNFLIIIFLHVYLALADSCILRLLSPILYIYLEMNFKRNSHFNNQATNCQILQGSLVENSAQPHYLPHIPQLKKNVLWYPRIHYVSCYI